MKKLFFTIIALGIVLLGGSASTEVDILKKLHANATKIAIPNITLPSVTNKDMISLDEYKGSLIVLSIWRSGCHYCQKEAPIMSELATLLKKNDNIKLIGLSTDRNIDEAKAFIKTYDLSYPNMMDPNAAYLERVGLKIRGTPTTYIIGPKGNLVGTIVGYDDMKAKTKYKYLKKLYAIYDQ